MFNSIAHRYDCLNHLLSFGVDIYWRKKTLKLLETNSNSKILDLATGTGDLAIEVTHLNNAKIVGIDIAYEMLSLGNDKIRKKKKDNSITLICGDIENLPLKSYCFDRAMIAFGIRNVSDIREGLKEVYRVLISDGKFAVLEFSNPENFFFKKLYHFYFRKILPHIGAFFSKDKNAYSYLPDSVLDFPSRTDFIKLMEDAGFSLITYQNFSLGIATLYIGTK